MIRTSDDFSQSCCPCMALAALPTDVLAHIFSFIPFTPRMLAISIVCHRWRAAALKSVTCVSGRSQRQISLFHNISSLCLDGVTLLSGLELPPSVQHLLLRGVLEDVTRCLSSLSNLASLTAYFGESSASDSAIFALVQRSSLSLTSLALFAPGDPFGRDSKGVNSGLTGSTSPFCPNLTSLFINSERLSSILYLHATQLTSLSITGPANTIKLYNLLSGAKSYDRLTHLDLSCLVFARYDQAILPLFPVLRSLHDNMHVSAYVKLEAVTARLLRDARFGWIHAVQAGSLNYADCFARSPYLSAVTIDAWEGKSLPCVAEFLLKSAPTLSQCLTRLVLLLRNDVPKGGEVDFLIEALPRYSKLHSLAIRSACLPDTFLKCGAVLAVSLQHLHVQSSTTGHWTLAQVAEFAAHFPGLRTLRALCLLRLHRLSKRPVKLPEFEESADTEFIPGFLAAMAKNGAEEILIELQLLETKIPHRLFKSPSAWMRVACVEAARSTQAWQPEPFVYPFHCWRI